MAGSGLLTSIVVLAVGAVLRFALMVNTYQVRRDDTYL